MKLLKAKIVSVTRYPAVGQEVHGRTPGSVMTVEFVLNGVPFTALNGGPLFKFNEAVSMQVLCRTQAEIDYYWEKLRAGGDPQSQQCGWLKDRFGLSWQVAPAGIRVVTIKTGGIPESMDAAVPGRDAIAQSIEQGTLLKRAARLEDVGNVAAFLASDQARTLTSTVVNISSGALVD